ncbi:DUF2017 family protein [Actinotalea sp. K2]|uniref:DUF2017 family protein n=1 Tax=Actinotalea sp. K2 TaxID=2939438 RepID=UPI0020172D8F|nr:DUF2017 family protein [Actinotalea sp. K2]MCL3860377.1 DUF2017 domain-containing protein [Actinotalea sp. K2]
MLAFGRTPDGVGIGVRLDAGERTVLTEVVDQVLALLSDDPGGTAEPGHEGAASHPLDGLRMDGPVEAPTDPALHRLLPDASRDDAEVTAEFRRLTEGDLRATKTGNLSLLRGLLDDARPDLVIPVRDAPGVAAALTDLRLVVSQRIGIRTDADAEAVYTLATTGAAGRSDRVDVGAVDSDGSAARVFLATVYVVLSLLQESLVDLLLDDLPLDGTEGSSPSDVAE